MAKYSTSLNLTWNVSDAPYTVEWQKTGCLAENQETKGSITTNDTSYNITGLKEGSKYNITVSAGELSNTVSAVTIEKVRRVFVVIMVLYLCVIFFPAPSTAPKLTLIFATSYSITLQCKVACSLTFYIC